MENNNYNQNNTIVVDGEEYLIEDLLESLVLMGGIEIKIDQIKNQVGRIENKMKDYKF